MTNIRSNPVFRLEARRDAAQRGIRNLQRGCMPIVLGVTGTALSINLALVTAIGFISPESFVAVLFGVSFAILVIIQIVAGSAVAILTIAQASATISGEVELQSWGLLRTTALPLRDILLGKLAGVAARLRAPLTGVIILRAVSTVTGILLLGYYILREPLYYTNASYWPGIIADLLWVPPVIAFVVFVAFYLTQPVLNFMVNAALGMFHSAHTKSRSRALVSGLGGRLALWIGVGLTIVVLTPIGVTLLTNWAEPFGSPGTFILTEPPTTERIIWALSLVAIGVVMALWTWQIGLILLMLGTTHARSEKLDA